MPSRLFMVAPLVAGLGALLASQSRPLAQEARVEPTAAERLIFAPNGAVLDVASLDHGVHVADLLWVKTVLEFGANYSEDPDPAWAEWLAVSILAIGELDPQWRTPYYFGGVMLRLIGEIEASTRVFKLGAERLPEEPYFPFSVGMNLYMHGDDPVGAAEWLERAAERPQAPEWYRSAALSFRQEGMQRSQALRYLREELEQTEDPRMQEHLRDRIAELMHEGLMERFAEASVAFVQRTGQALERPEQLIEVGLLRGMPEDPLGGAWVVDIDGVIRSSVDADRIASRDLKAERAMLRFMPR